MTLPNERQDDSAGVSQDEQQVQRAPTARERALEQIGEQAHAQRMRDVEESQRFFGELPAQDAAEPKADEPSEAPSAEAKAPEPEKPEEAMVEIKVDGELRRVPLSEVIEHGKRTLQKDSAADKRLNEASNVLQQLQRERALFNQMLQQQQRQAHGAAPNMQGEEREEATPDAKQILQQLDTRTQSHVVALLEAHEMRKWVQTNYPEIAGDQYLYGIAAKIVDDKHREGDARNDVSIYQEALDWVRDRYVPKPRESTVDTATLAAKAERKEEKVQAIPQAAGRKPTPQPEREPTTSEVIAQMRKARKQIVA